MATMTPRGSMTERPKKPEPHSSWRNEPVGGDSGTPPDTMETAGDCESRKANRSLDTLKNRSPDTHFLQKNASRFNFVSPQGETEGEMRRSRTDKWRKPRGGNTLKSPREGRSTRVAYPTCHGFWYRMLDYPPSWLYFYSGRRELWALITSSTLDLFFNMLDLISRRVVVIAVVYIGSFLQHMLDLISRIVL